MADADKKIQVLIETILNSKGIDEIKDKLSKLKVSGEDAAKGGDAMASSFNQAKGMLVGLAMEFVAVQSAVNFLGDSIKAALAEERMDRNLVNNIQALGGVSQETAAATLLWIDSLEIASTVSKEKLAPALTDLIAITGNVESAQRILAGAAGAAAAGMGTFEGNVSAMAKALEKGPDSLNRATDAFSVKLKQAYKDTGDINKAVTVMADKFKDGGAAVQDTGTKLERQKIAWNETKEAIGGLFTSLVTQLMPAFQGFANIIGGVVGTLKILITAIIETAKVEGKLAKSLWQMATGDFSGAWKTATDGIADGWRNVEDSIVSAGDALQDINNAFNKAGGGAAPATPEGGTITGGTGGKKKKGKGDDTKVELGDALAGMNRIGINAAEEFFKESHELELMNAELSTETEEDLLKAKVALLKQWLAASEGNARDLLKMQVDLKKGEKQLEVNALNDKKKAQAALLAQLKPGSMAYLLAQKKMYQDDLKNFKGTIAEKIKLEQQLGTITKQINKMKVASTASALSQGLSLAAGAFGQSKGMAITQATIHTYESAVSAYQAGVTAMASLGPAAIAGPVVGALFAGLAIAAGMKEIQEIKKADPSQGSGFDNPENDAIAELGGQRWAKDFTARFSAGIMRGMSGEMLREKGGAQTNYNYVQHQPGQVINQRNLNVGAMPMVDTAREPMMRDLARSLKTYDSLFEDGDL